MINFFSKKNKFDNCGQSIIELLIAIMVLSMVMVSVTLMATKSIQLSQTASFREKAISLARTEIERIRKNRDVDCIWSDFKNLNADCWVEDEYSSSGEKVIDDDYDAVISIGEPEIIGDKEVVSVNLIINWSDVKGDHNIEQNIEFSN